jgi:hypothetical protein
VILARNLPRLETAAGEIRRQGVRALATKQKSHRHPSPASP